MFNSPILWVVAIILCWGIGHATAKAQIRVVTATVTRSAPGATLYSGGAAPSTLRKGATLQPGDMINTSLSGRVVIDLSDGSQVVI
ncbi:MAG: hypothetical protein J2P52_17350, partial [Blastocatellia bacterium]|nr:hypothetical protein [Blastocatellia bacterium]